MHEESVHRVQFENHAIEFHAVSYTVLCLALSQRHAFSVGIKRYAVSGIEKSMRFPF